MLFPVYNCSSVWIVPVEDEEEGSEMERLEISSIAFFAGLSLISSPDREGKKIVKTSPSIGQKFKEEEDGGNEGESKIEVELTECVRAGLRWLALDSDDDGLLLWRGLRGGGFAGGRRRGRHDQQARFGRVFCFCFFIRR